MARNATDIGGQIITYDYAQSATTEDINKQIHKLVRPGVYDGFNLSIETGDPAQVRVSSGVAYVEAANASLGVRVETTEDVIRSDIAPSTSYVIIHFEWYNDPESYAEIKCVESAEIVEEDIVIGRGVFSGSTLVGFDLDDGVHPRDYISNYADTLPLGETATVVSNPTGGITTSLNGESTDVVEAIQEAFNRLIDLSGVNDNGVKNRHVDFGGGAAQVNGGDIPIASEISTGGTASNIADTNAITTALQSLATMLKNLSGADTNSVKERHIDFGVSPNQIDADLLPLGTAINKVLSEAADISFISTKAVRSAIADVVDRLASISSQVTANKNNINTNDSTNSGLQGQIDKTAGISVGVIWMYDGTNWTDDVTLPGWYACIPSNSDKGCPDLTDQFIKGGTTGTKGSSYGTSGGNSDLTLGANNLPPHTHDMSHGHTATAEKKKVPHTHSMYHTHNYVRQSGSDKADKKGFGSSVRLANDAYTTKSTGGSPSDTGTHSIEHDHFVTVNNYNAYTENGGFANIAIPIDPQHYKVIFIRKCYQR
jgi:hypothetical protein